MDDEIILTHGLVEPVADPPDLPLRAREHVGLAELDERVREHPVEQGVVVGEHVHDPARGPVAVHVLVDGEHAAVALEVLVVVVVHAQRAPLVVQEHDVVVRGRRVGAHVRLVDEGVVGVQRRVRGASPAAVNLKGC
jgi:hypothetical protein